MFGAEVKHPARIDLVAQKSRQHHGFLNVDLDVYSRYDLAPLVAALEPNTFVLYAGRESNRYGAHFELRRQPKSADAAILGLATIVRALPRPARAHWNKATTRDFNIGIQANSVGASEVAISLHANRIVASLNARIVITVYGERFGKARAQSPVAGAGQSGKRRRVRT